MNDENTLYRHFDKDGNLLYIGISIDAFKRYRQHRDKPWFKDIKNTTYESCETREIAMLAEQLAIKREKPIHNIVFNKVDNKQQEIYNSRYDDLEYENYYTSIYDYPVAVNEKLEIYSNYTSPDGKEYYAARSKRYFLIESEDEKINNSLFISIIEIYEQYPDSNSAGRDGYIQVPIVNQFGEQNRGFYNFIPENDLLFTPEGIFRANDRIIEFLEENNRNAEWFWNQKQIPMNFNDLLSRGWCHESKSENKKAGWYYRP